MKREDAVAMLEQMRNDGAEAETIEDIARRWLSEQNDPKERAEFVRQTAWLFGEKLVVEAESK